MKAYKCIIFDCDGVLVDSELLGNQVFVDMANEYGAGIDLNYAMQHFKGGFLNDSMNKVEAIIKRPLPKDFEPQYRKRSYEVFSSQLKAVDGVEKVLEKLRVPYCVASSGPQEKIRRNLSTAGLSSFFDANIFSCYDIGKWKPDPAIYLHASKTMGFLPKDCIVIEDSYKGAKAATSGGFDVYGYAQLNEDPKFEMEVTRSFVEMEELISLLGL
ncbi:HAD family hydrolase [Arenibacter aquaticus]|uniref:HAD family hydrolase n=1 Tax=Arenibacter aquaticus TaxID=2489054 RepID=A0A3S0ADD3_9FLAO|nr:HAD family hydrolase [Arenibacter aquaticus]RTE52929.1 HAD family hydrolase [Arenibacter aquaticus]